MKVTSSIISFLLFIVIISIPPVILQHLGNTALMVGNFWIIFFFMSGLTFLVLMVTLMIGSKNQEYLSQAFLAGTTFKILAGLVFIFVFLSKNAPDKAIFLGDFAYIYLLTMVFEIYLLLRNLRHKNLG